MMLHTDAFNKSNKNKMTKAGYIKNTRLPGVQPEVLDVRDKAYKNAQKIDPCSFSVSTTTSYLHRLFL